MGSRELMSNDRKSRTSKTLAESALPDAVDILEVAKERRQLGAQAEHQDEMAIFFKKHLSPYRAVDQRRIWDAVKDDLPPLNRRVRRRSNRPTWDSPEGQQTLKEIAALRLAKKIGLLKACEEWQEHCKKSRRLRPRLRTSRYARDWPHRQANVCKSFPQRKVSNDFRTAHMERADVIGSAVPGGIMSDASHDDLNDLKQRPHAGKSRGAGERWRKSFSGTR
jgi:hypothetical protein